MTTTELEAKGDNLFCHAQFLKTTTTGPQRTLPYGGVFEELPTNPTLLATCKQIFLLNPEFKNTLEQIKNLIQIKLKNRIHTI